MTGTCEWATYPRLLERSFFEWTKELYELEQKLKTPIQDSMHWTRRFEYPWILSTLYRNTALPHIPLSFLDAGAGATALQFMLTRQAGWKATSIDPDPAAVRWTKSICEEQLPLLRPCLVHPNTALLGGGFPVLPFPNVEFDVGICVSVLEHLPKDQVLPSIQELLRVSRKEVLITMDVVLGTRHPTQMDQSDFNQHMQTLKVEIPEPSHRITFQMDGYLFGVACLHLTR